MKKSILISIIVFFIVMVVVTILSTTFHQNKLPKVDLVLPMPDYLSYHILEKTTAQLNDVDGQYRLITNVPIEFDLGSGDDFFLYLDDLAEVKKVSSREQPIKGSIINIDFTKEPISVKVGFNSDSIEAGDFLEAKIDKIAYINTLFPKKSVFKDPSTDEDYVFTINEVDGPWGKRYQLEKAYIKVIVRKGELVGSMDKDFSKPVAVLIEDEIKQHDFVRFYP